MKKILFVLLVLAMMVVAGCSTPSTDSPKDEKKPETPSTPTNPETSPTTPAAYRAGDSARENIIIDGITYPKTGEVYVTGPNGATITGAVNTNNYAGVFIEDRNVTLSPYIMGKYEITQQLYTAVMTNQIVTKDGTQYTLTDSPFRCLETGDYPKVSTDTQNLRPAECVTWFDAVYFCNKLSEKMRLTPAYDITITTIGTSGYETGHITIASVSLVENANGYRLPTEAEWEFAARGGNQSASAWNYTFSGTDTAEGTVYTESKNTGLDTVGWYKWNLGGTTNETALSQGTPGYGTHEVGTKDENALHIFDMSGNVSEWCYDCDGGTITTGNVTNPSCVATGSGRIFRGGSWNKAANYCSVCKRLSVSSPGARIIDTGFRVVRNAN